MGEPPLRPGPPPLSPELLDAAVELMGRSGRGGTVRVQGRSMEPTLREGQLLDVDFAPGPVACGDLLLFRKDDHLVVHRLLGRARFADGRPCLRTRGDGAPVLDPPVDRGHVVGRVVAVEDASGRWRSVRGRTAQGYARCLAWHDLLWSVAGTLARLGERGLGRLGLGHHLPLARAVAAIDRGLLVLAHRALFPRLHTVVAAPQAVPRTPERGV